MAIIRKCNKLIIPNDKNDMKKTNLELKTVKNTLSNAVKMAKLGTWEWDLVKETIKFSNRSKTIY